MDDMAEGAAPLAEVEGGLGGGSRVRGLGQASGRETRLVYTGAVSIMRSCAFARASAWIE
jgi:hypothetical protein